MARSRPVYHLQSYVLSLLLVLILFRLVLQYCKRHGEVAEADKETASHARGARNPEGQVCV